MLIQAVILALAALGPMPAAPTQEAQVQEVQFRGRGGSCPDGYDFNYSNGRCFPNEYHAPGAYVRPRYAPYGHGYGDRYYRRHRHSYGYYDRY